ncbi:diguanylate cyclase [Candidatus Sulfurimonas baltica]|uniref:Diguanylate cyclase n=1 Tax=Candidatus Sulfurimonas baltica TaxID=2740404 RepID=A0A7S7LTB8_9BACT|nr:diguanylate cyclase [Candidatus Sulfurimonas baltica]QOY50980.1 diguanylate cyclase [Candidatus Sulfurimonas baltica]
MISKENIKTNILLTILLTIAMPIILGKFLHSYFHMVIISIPLHSAIEASGGVIAIVIAMIFYIKYSKNLVITHFNYSTIALLAMGIIDIFHASVMPGKMFVWLHSTAVFFGGIFFMSVWLKEIHVSKKVYSLIPIIFIIFPILFSLLSIYFSHLVPDMLNADKTFSTTANVLNIIGGLGFFIASLKFVLNYIKTQNTDEILFAGHTMLFGIAGVLFVSSVVWDMQWWLWHVLRLSAYIIAFYFLYSEYRNEIKEVEQTNEDLEMANEKIVEFLDIVDKNVITSTTDLEGNILSVSQAFCDISGYSKDELIGMNHNIVRHPDQSIKIYNVLWKTINSGKVWNGELLNRKKDGSGYWVAATVTPQFDSDGTLHCFTAVRQDITDKKNIEILSITDSLTNLYNRRYFNTTIEKEISRAKRDGKYLGFLMMDIDHFKLYNDTYGHQKGDIVLQEIGKVLTEYTQRASDFSFRLGGEEFGILFSGLNESDSLEFAQNVLKAIEDLKIEHKRNTASKYVTASAGLIIRKNEILLNCEETYLLADKLLYKAKEKGRNRVELI